MNEFEKIATVVTRAAETLRPVSESPRLDAELLLSLALDVPRSYLVAHPDDELDPGAGERFDNLLERRRSGAPMAYITGEKEFWSLKLMVSPDTLVPRPETEILVELALREIPRGAAWRILDLGTGSGAIALAIASERRNCDVVGIDISGRALAIARQNARQLDLPNVSFLEGSWIEPVRNQVFDLIVANPPYVRAGHVALGRLTHEPRLALVAGKDGLDAIRQIVAECHPLLVPGHAIILEHADDQQSAVAGILDENGWSTSQCMSDLAGKPRVTIARRPN